MSFQTRTLTIAIWILVLMLGLIAVSLMVSKGNTKWPPQIGNCPDYWQVLADGTCQNVKTLGNGCESPKDFSTAEFKGKKGLIKKCKIMKACKASWDGVTNVGAC